MSLRRRFKPLAEFGLRVIIQGIEKFSKSRGRSYCRRMEQQTLTDVSLRSDIGRSSLLSSHVDIVRLLPRVKLGRLARGSGWFACKLINGNVNKRGRLTQRHAFTLSELL